MAIERVEVLTAAVVERLEKRVAAMEDNLKPLLYRLEAAENRLTVQEKGELYPRCSKCGHAIGPPRY